MFSTYVCQWTISVGLGPCLAFLLVQIHSASRNLSISNDHGTSVGSYDDLVDLSSVDVHARPNTVGPFLGIFLFGIPECQIAWDDKMCCERIVWMRCIICVAREHGSDDVYLEIHLEIHSIRVYELTHGPSVQVRTCLNPQDCTSSSSCFPMVVDTVAVVCCW